MDIPVLSRSPAGPYENVTIRKSFDFDAAHFLPHVPEGHKCRRMHGHTYKVEVTCMGVPQTEGPEAGMVVDYARIDKPILEALDHRTLNDVLGLENPTTEILAPWILNRLRTGGVPAIFVEVFESTTTSCTASWRT